MKHETPPEPDESALDALQHFILELRQVHRNAGEPAYAALVRRMNEFSKTTISRVLNGAEPSWPFTRSFLGACGVSDATIAQVWHPKWTALQDVLHPLVITNPASVPGNRGEECGICGGLTGDAQRHADYHRLRGELPASSGVPN